MTDDRLHRWLRAADQPLAPDAAFAAALRDELRGELGFSPAGTARPITIGRARTRVRAGREPSSLLVAAALVVAAALGFAAVAGSLVERRPEQRPTLLDDVRQAGRVRMAISPDHPQFATPGQPAAGFDADVAREIADHLGLAADIVVINKDVILSGRDDALWDVALPSVATWEIDGSTLLVSSPYYRWPRWLVVSETSSATTPAGLAGDRVCAVADDAGEAWLRGEYGGASSSPITSQVVTLEGDGDCFAALSSGDVAGVVTARLSQADLQVRSGIKVIGGPNPEPRPVIVQRGHEGESDPVDLLRAIDDALAGMRLDGTLTRLSQNRFGGADLTAP